MKSPLSDLISHLHKQNEILGKARDAYLSKDAEKKHFEATLTSNAKGKSHAERVTAANADKSFLEFHKSLARLEAVFKFQELKFQILEKEFQSGYLQLKLDQGLIDKGEG